MKLFASKKMMYGSAIVIIVSFVYIVIWNIAIKRSIDEWNAGFCFTFLSAISSGIILYTFVKHNSNSMKPAIGILLGVNIYQSINAFISNFFFENALNQYLDAGFSGRVSLTLDILDFLLTVLFCFNHIVLSAGHNSSAARVKLNKFLCFALIIEYIMQVIMCINIFSAGKLIYLVFFYLLASCDLTLVLCVETKLDYFRILRESKSE